MEKIKRTYPAVVNGGRHCEACFWAFACPRWNDKPGEPLCWEADREEKEE